MSALFIAFFFILSLWALPAHAQAASVSMAWDYNGTGYTNFQVHRCVASALNLDCVPTADLGTALPLTQKTYTDATPLEGSRYCYNVVATRPGVAASVPSNTVCKSVPIAVTGGPSNLREIP